MSNITFAVSSLENEIVRLLQANPDVPGVSIGLIIDNQITALAAGKARVLTNEIMTTDHRLECASLSKTIAAAFAFEYFSKRGIPMTASVNNILRLANSQWRIGVSLISSLPSYIADDVTLAMLVNHTALGMHYVYGIPISNGIPPVIELLQGKHKQRYKYEPLYLEKVPGSKFAYSGGGFLVLQHILEQLEGKSIDVIMQPFLNQLQASQFTFYPSNQNGIKYAYGHLNRQTEVQPDDSGRLSFPPLAAGGICTAEALTIFLQHLVIAYNNPQGSSILSNATARAMLSEESLVDLGAIDFMNAKAGYGVFVAQAGPNKVMLHQAANDGFRGVYVICFDGPDTGNGFVILANGDNPAIPFMCDLSKFILGSQVLNMRGVDFTRVKSEFNFSGLKQEVIVNLGLKELVFKAFLPLHSDGHTSQDESPNESVTSNSTTASNIYDHNKRSHL